MNRVENVHGSGTVNMVQAGRIDSVTFGASGPSRTVSAITARKQALEAYQELGDRHGKARTWHNLAFALRETGQPDQAREAAEQARQAYLQAHDPDSAAAVED
ncbi:tetratricopeptide repeat protein [Saccharopolyspora erythraea]|uniref:tetratricopeptide repeat protein n=1 Tax=Saccharopolyspora erythraea TaxID=1836 RepID=UPI00201341E6|nr:tetratricopeptide repeat protein [Saccharopolyspora erythraea]